MSTKGSIIPSTLRPSASAISVYALLVLGAFSEVDAQLTEVWVDFTYPSIEIGTPAQPFDTLAEALSSVDPNGAIHVAPGASHETLSITGPVTIQASSGLVRIGDLSSPFGSGTPYEVLKITELMYNPGDGGAEYLELQNTGFQSLDVSGVYFSEGIVFTFPADTMLAPGEYTVLIRDSDLSFFLDLYPGVSIDGAYSGALSNGRETISLSDPQDNMFLTITYNDGFPWPAGADGQGFSLVIIDPQVKMGGGASNWRASGELGGSPAQSDIDPNNPVIFINEALTHTDAPQVDSVEIYNPTGDAVDIRGWFLTDDLSLPQKAIVPDRPEFASIPAGGYAIIDETDFFDAPGSIGMQTLPGFRLSSHGEDIYIFSANALGYLTGYVHGFSFEGSENGVSFGRHVTSDGREHFVAQTANTFGAANAGPAVGPVVITEVHYHPLPNGVEYVEITNISNQSVKLWDDSPGGDSSKTFRITGIGFSFDTGIAIPKNDKILVVDTEPAAYIAQFGDPGIPVYGPFGNDPELPEDTLSNGGETIRLQWPDTPDEVTPGVFITPYIDMDPVRYNDGTPWPDADGNGDSLIRVGSAGFGGEPSNWIALGPSYQPGQGVSTLAFSVPRGFYDGVVNLTLSTATTGANIRFTMDGTVPTDSNGTIYSTPIVISSNTVIRASGFKTDFLNSAVETHTYIMNADAAAKSLPAISVVGDPGGSLYEPDGVMAIVGGHYEPEDLWYEVWKSDGPGDYNNPMQRGIDFERPVSFEVILPADNSGFQEDCGLRVHGSSWHRPRYFRANDWTGCTSDNLNYAKFSFRLIFRKEYGAKRLEYPLIPASIRPTHDQVVLRGGHNDTCDPFIHDELARRLYSDMGHVASLGMLAHLFLNGEYKGFYNPAERIDEKFLQDNFFSTADWDVITHRSQVRNGDDVAWIALLDFAQMQDLSNQALYDQMASMIDVDDFIDYLILELFTNNADWPDVNWISARERTPGAKWQFYVWDSEFAFRPDYLTRIGFNEYPQNRGDGLNGEETEIAWIYRALRANPAFSQSFNERVHLHMLGTGALALQNVTNRFTELQLELDSVLPGMSTFILDEFLPVRYNIVLDAFFDEGLYTP